MPRPVVRRHDREVAALRADLAGIAVDLGLIRVRRAVNRKYHPDQPRVPAGRSEGGRWVPARSGDRDPETTGSIGPKDQAETRTEEAVTEDGSHVLSIRIRSNPRAEWDEQHTVTAPDGARTVFETSGLTQTVRDGETGEVLGRSTLTADGAVAEALVQPARGVRKDSVQQGIKRALEAAASVFAAISGRDGDGRKAVFAAPASEYVPGDAYNERAMWVGMVDQSELDRICPRNREVQALADAVTAEVKASGNYMDARDLGNKVHARIADIVNDQKDPDFVAESSYDPTTGTSVHYGTRGSIRLDLYEKARPATVCVYDHKTGDATLKDRRAVDIMAAAQKIFPVTLRYIMIVIKPNP